MKKTVKSLALGASILAVSAGGALASANLINNNNSIVTNNINVKELMSVEDFLLDIANYDWEANDYIYELNYDVNFEGASYSEIYSDNANLKDQLNSILGDKDLEKTIDGNGHSFIGMPVVTSSLMDERNYLFEKVENMVFSNIVFDGFAFLINDAQDIEFRNIVFKNVDISDFSDTSIMAGSTNNIGFLVNTVNGLTVDNFIVENINIQNNNLTLTKNVSYELDSHFSTGIFGVVEGSAILDGVFVNGFNYQDQIVNFFTFPNSEINENDDLEIASSVLFAKSTSHIGISNSYFSNINYSNVYSNDGITNEFNIITSDFVAANALTSDVVIDDSIKTDSEEVNLFSEDEFDSFNTYAVSNSKALNSGVVDTVSSEEMYSTDLFNSILGDVDFIVQNNGNRPFAITDDSIYTQIDSISEEEKFAKVSQSITYSTKSLFTDTTDNSVLNQYSVGIKKGDKVLVEQNLESEGTFDVTYAKQGDKELFIRDNQTNEYVASVQVWENDPFYIMWTFFIFFFPILIIILLIIFLISTRNEKGKERLAKVVAGGNGNKEKEPKPVKVKKEKVEKAKSSKPKKAKTEKVKASKSNKKAKSTNKNPKSKKSDETVTSNLPLKEDEYFYFNEENLNDYIQYDYNENPEYAEAQFLEEEIDKFLN